MSDEYRDYPKSLGEVKSAKSMDSADWTPRECLINMLREIDNGLNVDLLIISLRYKDGDKSRFRFSQSSNSGIDSVGLLHHNATMMIVE